MNNDMGGPAFPCLDSDGNGETGLTVWDYYAAAALPAIIQEGIGQALEPGEVTHDAALYADAMMAERNERINGESE